jgi:hypothetical protein
MDEHSPEGSAVAESGFDTGPVEIVVDDPAGSGVIKSDDLVTIGTDDNDATVTNGSSEAIGGAAVDENAEVHEVKELEALSTEELKKLTYESCTWLHASISFSALVEKVLCRQGWQHRVFQVGSHGEIQARAY